MNLLDINHERKYYRKVLLTEKIFPSNPNNID